MDKSRRHEISSIQTLPTCIKLCSDGKADEMRDENEYQIAIAF